MKKSVKFLGTLAMLITLTAVFFAFKPAQRQTKALQYWEYVGTTDPTDQMQYQPASGPSCASGTNVVCTILAEEDLSSLGYPKIAGEPIEGRITSKDENSGDVFVRN